MRYRAKSSTGQSARLFSRNPGNASMLLQQKIFVSQETRKKTNSRSLNLLMTKSNNGLSMSLAVTTITSTLLIKAKFGRAARLSSKKWDLNLKSLSNYRYLPQTCLSLELGPQKQRVKVCA